MFNTPNLKPASTASQTSTASAPNVVTDRYYRCMIAARSNKKHKQYSDGILHTHGRTCALYTDDARLLIRKLAHTSTASWGEGEEVIVGNWEVEVGPIMAEEEFLSGRCFIEQPSSGAGGSGGSGSFVDERREQDKALQNAAISKPFTPLSCNRDGHHTTPTKSQQSISAPPSSQFGLYDLNDPSLLVLNRDAITSLLSPSTASASSNKRKRPTEQPVIVEPFITRSLRPHQREGVQFLYDRIVGQANAGHSGAILADEMGLGKTLQSIALLYTLLRTGPAGSPVIRKAVVVCPSTLVQNWLREFKKWVGTERLKVRGVEASSGTETGEQEVQAFVTGNALHVLVIGYEMFRKHSRRLRELKDALYVCDEGHRLKNSKGNQTIQALTAITCRRRLLLTGTPVQNDLLELYAMCDWVNPSYLGEVKAFRSVFEQPIARSRESGVSGYEKELGRERSKLLSERTASFVLRRDARLLRQYLPPKTECVLFCPLQPLQREVYGELLKTKVVRRMQQRQQEMDGRQNPLALTCLNTLVQVSNHPMLLFERAAAGSVGIATATDSAAELLESDELSEVYAKYPEDYESTGGGVEESGKMRVLMALLAAVKAEKGKAVVASNYVRTLNVIEALCTSRQWPVLRLDGHIPSSTRQSLVDDFNSPHHTAHVFLLSSKAGGQGLNLIGGNRLVLFDPSWNPATDLQAMARIWRDGQQNAVVVYRLLSVGCVDEKIYQRQLKKQAVASMLETAGRRGRGAKLSFDSKALRELFTCKPADCECDTYDLLMGMSGQSSEGTVAQGKTGAKSATGSGGRERELTVGGKRWECSWNVRESGEEMVRALDDGLVSCVWWRTSTADDDDEEFDFIAQADTETEEAKVDTEEAEDNAEKECGEAESNPGSNDMKPAAVVAADNEKDDDDTSETEAADEHSSSQPQPRNRKRPKQEQKRTTQRPAKQPAVLPPDSDDEDEAFPSYQPAPKTLAETQPTETMTAEEREAVDMAELQQLVGAGAGRASRESEAVGAVSAATSAQAAGVAGTDRWDSLDGVDLDMSD